MPAWRDKGPVPLSHPDGKMRAAYDAATGFMAVAVLDLQAHTFALWYQPLGWVTPARGQSYGPIDLTDWAITIHDGTIKLVGITWKDTSPDGQPHIVFEDLLAIAPR